MSGSRRMTDVEAELEQLLAQVDQAIYEALYEGELEGAEAFFRVLSVLSGRVPPRGRARPLRVGPPMKGGGVRNQLWGTSAGVFLSGATEAQARQWAEQQAARYGGRVLNPERHGVGRWHMHIELPNGIRSGHIFWGPPPSGDFFDYNY